MSRLALLASLFAVGLSASDRLPDQPTRRVAGRPTLVVLVAVDQLRADYLSRWPGQLTGGLGRLEAQGTVFEHGHQEHAITETAPGHSTMLSGREPASTGIVVNSRGVQDPSAPALGVHDTVGSSPRRFRGTTLYDWIVADDAGARVLSVSRKDRGAILPVGRARGEVYWYRDSIFTTSRYYADALPPWVRAYNARRGPQKLAGTVWNTLLPAARYAEPDSIRFENGGKDVAFPHRLPTDAAAAASELPSYPWMDSLTLDMALEGVARTELGQRGHTDLLVVSLSTTDAVGHAFGPDSREVHDQVLRVDRWLGWFLDSLQRVVPKEQIVLALTADHGVVPLPEYTTAVRHGRAGRVWLGGLASRTGARLSERYHVDFDVAFDAGLLSADVAALRARGVDVDSLAEALAREARRTPGVARVYTPATLGRAPGTDVHALRWRRELPPDFGWLLCAVTEPNWVWSSGGAGAVHGGTSDDDVEVPIIFAGAGIGARHVARVARTVDIGPTFAALLGVRPTERLDGVPLPEVIGQRSAAHTATAPRRSSGAPARSRAATRSSRPKS